MAVSLTYWAEVSEWSDKREEQLLTPNGKTRQELIDVLNDQMVAAGVRIFVGGLQPARNAKSLHKQPDGAVIGFRLPARLPRLQ
ncbi:MAG TPA: hypothetical protein VGL82_01225 [Bryobacteraceae bacterium]|jgi:hypothetical protein